MLGFGRCSPRLQEEMIPHQGLSESQLEMRKHMRSETQGNGMKAYLSFCCLVYAPLMGHSSFIYSTQKLTCQPTHCLTSRSPEKPVTAVSKIHRLRCEMLLLHWEDRVFHLLEVSLISQRCSFWNSNRLEDDRYYHLFFSCLFFFSTSLFVSGLRCCCSLCRTQSNSRPFCL